MSSPTPRIGPMKQSGRTSNLLVSALFLVSLLASVAPTVGAAPLISGVSPTTGSANGGTEVTLTGSGFESGATVKVDSTFAKGVQVISSTTLKFLTPPHAAGAAGFVVTNPDGHSTSFNNAFTYTVPPAPTLTDVAPGSGGANGGTTVAITGTGFHTDPRPSVTFDGNQAIVSQVSATSLTVISPPKAGGVGVVNVVVTNPDGQATSAGSFAYLAAVAPSVTSVTPITGITDGGTSVTISGAGFAPGASVTFGGDPAAKVTISGPTQITAVSPARVAGAGAIVVTNPDGQTTSSAGFTYVAPTTAIDVTAVSPVKGPTVGGTKLIVTGAGFHKDVTVTVGGTAAHSVQFVSTTVLEVIAPAGTAGAADIVVTNPQSGSDTLVGGFTYITPARIDSLGTPTAPSVGGTSVTLTGSGFQAGARVFFGSVESKSVTDSGAPTSLVAVVPPQAAGAVDVMVVNPDGTSATISNAFTYTQSAAPTVTALSGSASERNGGELETVTGTGFATTSGFKPQVRFGTVLVPDADVSVSSETALVIKVPPRTTTTSPHIVDVRVTNPDGQQSANTASDDYGYSNTDSAPKVLSISPTSGTSNGGTQVTLTSTTTGVEDFFVDPNPGTGVVSKPTVKFGTVTVPASDVTVNSASSITVKVPARLSTTGPTNVPVTVTNPDGRVSTTPTGCSGSGSPPAGGCYQYTAAASPTITSVSPTSGSPNGGTSVTVTGTGFAYAASPNTPVKPTVRFGSTDIPAASVTVVSATQITVITPGGVPGSISVSVTNPDGKAVIAASSFAYNAVGSAPAITTVSPETLPSSGGALVTISGTGFAGSSSVKPVVSLGGTAVAAEDITSVSSTSITFKSPARTAGSVTVSVTNPDGQGASIGNSLRYLGDAPKVSSLSAATGSANGGTTLTLTGTNLAHSAPSVLVGDTIAKVSTVSATSISAILPSHASGVVSVVAYNLDGQSATRYNAFTYTAGAQPTFTLLAPLTGSINGGTEVGIIGQNFAREIKVTVGGKDATGVTVAADGKSMTFVTPDHTLGPKTVVFTNPDGKAITLARGFGYVGTIGPTLTSVSPSSGNVAGGTTITVTGANFVSGATVRVGGASATSVQFVSSTQITATTPAGTAGVASVTVTNPDGQGATLANGFTYTGSSPPDVTSVSPSTGPTNGGTTVTITGSNFVSGATVLFGATAATDVQFVSSTSLTAKSPATTAGTGAVSVTVTNPDNQADTLANGFTYTAAAAPVITGVSPATGPTTGATVVTISGTGFAAGATVSFGTVSATPTSVSETAITVGTPGHAAGVVDVKVTNPDGQSDTEADAFTYETGPAPTVSSITPATGPMAGGTSVTIAGTNFATGATVQIGGSLATGVTVASSTQITAITPAGTAGSRDIVVTNPDSQIGTLSLAFTYVASSLPDTATIAASNGDIQDSVKVKRSGQDNVVKWSLAGIEPAPDGVDVWRSTSPFEKIATLEGTDATAGEYVDEAAPADAKYIVTTWYAKSEAGGFVTELANAPGYVGLSEDDLSRLAASVGDGNGGFPWWAWVLIAVGALLIIGLIIGVILASRKRSPEDEDSWDDDELSWDDEVDEVTGVAEEAYNLECPRCDHEFTAHGEKPLHTTCPNCGVAGVLR